MSNQKSIPWAEPYIAKNVQPYVVEAVQSTWLSGGPFIEKFEQQLSHFLDVPFVISTSSGTTALQLALCAYGVGPGDEVIVPGYGFAGAVNMVLACGATPCFVDVDRATWCVDPACVESAVTAKTKAIVVIHTYGAVCDMEPILACGKKCGVPVIEDAAEAFGSLYQSRYAGALGSIGCFSFQATKNLSVGEGGCVTTFAADLYEKMKLIRNHGMSVERKYWHEVLGYNFRMTNIHAAVGCGQFEDFDFVCTRRREIVRQYDDAIASIDGVVGQHFSHNTRPVVWGYAVKIDTSMINRDELSQAMFDCGIEIRPGFSSFSDMPLYRAPHLPVSEMLAHSIIVLPTFVGLSDDDIAVIVAALKKGVR